jgi:uncharacterized protein
LRSSCRITGMTIGVVMAMALAGCADSTASPLRPTSGPVIPKATAETTFSGHGSIGQAYVDGAVPGSDLLLVDAARHQVGSGRVDRLGALVIRQVTPGAGYTFQTAHQPQVEATAPFRVLSIHDTPPRTLYSSQSLNVGLNYIRMRDGVELAATVRLPPGKTLSDGPFPTVIEDSGYADAAPHSLIQSFVSGSGSGSSDPLVPDTSTAIGSVLAPLLGFASISLQMRGTGCSGGAFGLFDLPTTYDGYDAVETVAAQPWVKGHKVGLVGISFSGISQMFVAGTHPPHLAAIAPMSLTDDLYSTGYPGGIFNDGFAATWIAQRAHDAEPAPEGGQPYARALIEQGDRQCLANQDLHVETQNIDALLNQTTLRDPALFDHRSPSTWASKVTVPVFLVGAFQDEQTGGQWPSIVADFARNPHVWVTMVNGTHIDSFGPATISRWIEFLHLFVADDLPSAPPVLSALGPVLYRQITGAPSETIPPLRFTHEPNLRTARHDFEQDPRVRVLFDNGGGSLGPGAMQPEWEFDTSTWPPPQSVATTWNLAGGGSLTTEAPNAGTVSFHPDPSTRPATDLPTGNPWSALPPYTWAPVIGPSGLGFISDPLPHDMVSIGPASLDLQLESTASNTDLQVTVSEVRPDGTELFIQSGDLRADDRALDPQASSPLHPVPTYLARDVRPLPAGSFTGVRIPILPFAYAFRAGSRIRITITAPGGDRPVWQFATPLTHGSVTDTLGLGGVRPSALVLPIVPGLTPSDPQPACPSLRGQPCRPYQPAQNAG